MLVLVLVLVGTMPTMTEKRRRRRRSIVKMNQVRLAPGEHGSAALILLPCLPPCPPPHHQWVLKTQPVTRTCCCLPSSLLAPLWPLSPARLCTRLIFLPAPHPPRACPRSLMSPLAATRRAAAVAGSTGRVGGVKVGFLGGCGRMLLPAMRVPRSLTPSHAHAHTHAHRHAHRHAPQPLPLPLLRLVPLSP